jgi:predicted ATP-grasp superfamily ATP-dependent carboligase
VRSEDDARCAAANLTFPCVVKPPNKAGRWAEHTTKKAFKLDGPGEVVPFYRDHRDWSDTLLVQEWVSGPESNLFSCNAYFDASSTPLATFVARKERQWPPRTGDSSLGVECRNDRVLSVALELFQGVGYRGLGYLEMKQDDRTGEMLIMEPNVGRPTGRSAIAEAGGVELLYTMYCDVVGLPLPAARTQRYTGVKWVNLRKDTQAAMSAIREGELTVPGWLRSWRGPKAFAVWSLRDPAPFFADILISIGRGLSRLLTRAKPGARVVPPRRRTRRR